MFEVEINEPGRPRALTHSVVDLDRDASLNLVEFVSAEGLWLMKMVIKGATIPFSYRVREEEDLASKEPYFIDSFDSFGDTTLLKHKHGIQPHVFNSSNEENQTKMLAAEALLVFGNFYDGDKLPDGKYRVEVGGRLFTKKDFGMS